MQNIFKQSPLSIRNILSFLNSTDIINLETVHPKFRLLGDLELYQQAITDIFEHVNNNTDYVSHTFPFSTTYQTTNNDRSAFLKAHNLVENPIDNSLHDPRYPTYIFYPLIWKCPLNTTTQRNYLKPALITNSEINYNPLQDTINLFITHLKNQTILEFSRNCLLLENICLSFDCPANLENYLTNIINIELIIGDLIINIQPKFELEMFWRNQSTNENYLPLFGQNISTEQPLFIADLLYQSLKIFINYDQTPEIQPEIQIIGYMTPVFSPFPISERFIIQNQYIGCNKITHKMQDRIKLYFNHPVLIIYLVIDSNNDCNDEIIEKISFIHNDVTWASFKPDTLRRVIPQYLAMPSLKNQKYYIISFNQCNPFTYAYESYEQTINFSRLDQPKLVVNFKYPFTGNIQIMGSSLNIAQTGNGSFSLMYAN